MMNHASHPIKKARRLWLNMSSKDSSFTLWFPENNFQGLNDHMHKYASEYLGNPGNNIATVSKKFL